MALWRKPLQFINVMLANRSPMRVAERGPGRMAYAKKKIKPFAEHDLRVTLHCAGKNKNKKTPNFYFLFILLTIGRDLSKKALCPKTKSESLTF